MNPNEKPYRAELRRLIDFADPELIELPDAEIDAMTTDLGGNFAVFNAKLDQKLRLAELKSADVEMSSFQERLHDRSKEISQRLLGSVANVRQEIEQRIAGLHGQPASAYFRQYKDMPEEDLPDLLSELEILQEDSGDASSGD